MLKPLLKNGALSLYDKFQNNFQKQCCARICFNHRLYSITESKTKTIRAWRSTYTTIFDGARNPAILDGGLKIDEFSTKSFEQLDFETQ